MKLAEALLETEYIRKQREVAKECESLLELIRANPKASRKELIEQTGWSKEKLNNRIQTLRVRRLLSVEKKWLLHCD